MIQFTDTGLPTTTDTDTAPNTGLSAITHTDTDLTDTATTASTTMDTSTDTALLMQQIPRLTLPHPHQQHLRYKFPTCFSFILPTFPSPPLCHIQASPRRIIEEGGGTSK
jgi:hypothetical protein